MKKILISKQSLSKTYSGACRSVHEEILYFKAKGFEVHTISEDINKEDLEASGAVVHKSFRWPWQKKINRRLQFSKQTKKLADKLKPSLTIGHGDYQFPDIHFIHNCVHLANERIHGKALSPNNEMYQIHTPIFKERQFKHIAANSELVKNELITRFGIPSSDISVIYPSVNEKQFYPFEKEKTSAVRAELGIKEDEFLIGLITSGNFKKRGVDRFFKAINLLPESIANKCHFVLVGKDKLSPEYEELLDENRFKDRIKFLPVINDVESYFNALDIFVLPARIEEFGRVVAEAMACGAPIITTKWVGASELMKGESANFIYDGEDHAELSALILRLVNDKELRDKVSLENRESASTIFESKLGVVFDRVFTRFLDS